MSTTYIKFVLPAFTVVKKTRISDSESLSAITCTNSWEHFGMSNAGEIGKTCSSARPNDNKCILDETM